ncbi:MAG: hypothetical protein AAGH78_03385 [Cyanobacteria bacterium P01_H01_bin.58]
MSTFSGLEGKTTTGSIGIAVIPGVGGDLAFQNFQTDADTSALTACLTINGNLTKRTVELGNLPETSGSFNVPFPADTDISLFNVLIVKSGDTCIGKAQIA